MLSEVFLFVILVKFTPQTNVACLDIVEDPHWEAVRIQRGSFFDSFNNLFTSLKTFFGLKSKDLEDKRQRVKSALESFFEELNKKKDKIKPGKSNMEPVQWVIPGMFEPRVLNLSAYESRKLFDIKPETTAEQLITEHGYRSESHTVLTADGYMLTMQRVVPDFDKANRRVVLINHGILGSAEDWLLLGPQRALPYMLSDNGYDVWLLNARGNKYSRIHTTKNIDKQDFWDFSWHEMGVYDLPTVIKHITEITRNAEINYVGHSMGSTALLVLLSTLPEYNYILRSAILLAPLAFMFHAKGPIRLLADFYSRNGHDSLNFLGQTEFMRYKSFPLQIIERFCKGGEKACWNSLLLLANGGEEMYSKHLMEDILAHTPSGGSVKTIIHYVQSVRSGFFQMFDYGAINNIRKYGNSTPPCYNLNKVTLPLAIFSSPSDWLSTVADMQTLLPLLQDVNVHHVVKTEDFNHLDFVWSQDAPELVFNFILTILDQILPHRRADFFQV